MNSPLQAFAGHWSRTEDSSSPFLFLSALRESCQCTRAEQDLTEEPQTLSTGKIKANKARAKQLRNKSGQVYLYNVEYFSGSLLENGARLIIWQTSLTKSF